MRSSIRRALVGVAYLAGAVVALVLVLTAFILLTWNRPVRRAIVAMTAPRDAAHVARGRYLYQSSMLCWDCHGSGEVPGPGEPQSGGRVFDLTKIGPGFGVVYGTNVTSDVETGIGAWSDGELVRAIREGVDREGHVIFPVMAYQFYNGLSDDDALSIVAYMRTFPPVRHRVPDARPSFAAKAVIALGMIKPSPAITAPAAAPPRSATVEYGRYVAWHASGCAECHTPRDPQTAKADLSRLMAGGLFEFPEPLFHTTGSNLTLDPSTGIGGWTREQFVAAVRTGVRPNGRVLLPFMPWPAYARWDEDDVDAVWAYLRSLPPIAHRVPESRLADGSAAAGEAIYGAYCARCHGARGAGTPYTTASLSAAARDLDDETLGTTIADGIAGTAMPGFGKTLGAEQIRAVAATIRGW